MAVILQQVMPEGVPLQLVDEVTEEMSVDANPPDGLLVHVHYERDGQVHVVDVWDSEQSYESFRDARLQPAMQAVAQRHGMDAPPQRPDETITPVHRVVRGR